MHFVKGVGVLLITSCCLLLGVWLCAYERARYRQAEGFLSLLQYIRLQIDCFSLPLPQILRSADSKLLGDCRLPHGGDDLTVLLQECNLLLPADFCRTLYDFAAALGGAYREEQLRSCEYYIARITPLCKEMRRELPRRLGLWRLLPISLSAALVLLLI